MAISKDKKVTILKRVEEILKDFPTVVFVNFHGLSVLKDTELRSQLHEQGVGYFVAKKTLVRKALEDASVEGSVPGLEGELALAFGQDAVAPARSVHEFGKKNDGAVSILGGIWGGRLYDKAAMEEIATIPPLEVLYGQIVNVINSPIQGLAVALNAIADKKA